MDPTTQLEQSVDQTDQQLFAAGGNPYGTSYASGHSGDRVSEEALVAARILDKRLAQVAARLNTREDEDPVPAPQGQACSQA